MNLNLIKSLQGNISKPGSAWIEYVLDEERFRLAMFDSVEFFYFSLDTAFSPHPNSSSMPQIWVSISPFTIRSLVTLVAVVLCWFASPVTQLWKRIPARKKGDSSLDLTWFKGSLWSCQQLNTAKYKSDMNIGKTLWIIASGKVITTVLPLRQIDQKPYHCYVFLLFLF